MSETNADKLCNLMQVQLRASRYYFGRIRNVRNGRFNDGMLRSNAFLAMEKVCLRSVVEFKLGISLMYLIACKN